LNIHHFLWNLNVQCFLWGLIFHPHVKVHKTLSPQHIAFQVLFKSLGRRSCNLLMKFNFFFLLSKSKKWNSLPPPPNDLQLYMQHSYQVSFLGSKFWTLNWIKTFHYFFLFYLHQRIRARC
jgi:hypothetical protein